MARRVQRYQKYLRQYPQITECYVRLEREPSIEDLLQENSPPRRKSMRLFMNRMNIPKNKPARTEMFKSHRLRGRSKSLSIREMAHTESCQLIQDPSATERTIARNSRLRCRSKSVSNREMSHTESRQIVPDSSVTESTIVKSVLKKNNLRGRSKSVSFDPNPNVLTFASDVAGLTGSNDSSSSARKVARMQSVDHANSRFRGRSTSFSDAIAGPSGLTVPRPIYCQPNVPQSLNSKSSNSAQPLNLTVSHAGFSSEQTPSSEADISLVNDENLAPEGVDQVGLADTNRTINLSNPNLSSGEILGYENRIASLVVSNKSKINRIRELIAERIFLLSQVETLHRLNESLAQTVDMYRNDESTQNGTDPHLQDQINRLQEENTVLRGRVDRLNRQQFELQKENKKLKTSASTYAKRVLGEHNYNM